MTSLFFKKCYLHETSTFFGPTLLTVENVSEELIIFFFSQISNYIESRVFPKGRRKCVAICLHTCFSSKAYNYALLTNPAFHALLNLSLFLIDKQHMSIHKRKLLFTFCLSSFPCIVPISK